MIWVHMRRGKARIGFTLVLSSPLLARWISVALLAMIFLAAAHCEGKRVHRCHTFLLSCISDAVVCHTCCLRFLPGRLIIVSLAASSMAVLFPFRFYLALKSQYVVKLVAS